VFKCIIFDLDGTLVDSEGLNVRALSELIETADISTEDLKNTYRGWKLSAIVDDIVKKYKITIPDNFIASYRQHVGQMYRTELKAFVGVTEVLQTTKIPVCVASNAPLQKIVAALEITNLGRFFGRKLFSAYDIGSWKPDPELFLTAARAMNVQPHECLVVEDSAAGVQAAMAARMYCLKFLPNIGPRNEELCSFSDYSEFYVAVDDLVKNSKASSPPCYQNMGR